MRKILSLFLILLLVLGTAHAAEKVGGKSKDHEGTVYQFRARTIDGKIVPLSRYKGKIILVVNVASKCGYTPQYAGLQKLHEVYGPKGLVILGFPCDQFGGQEPGSDMEIKAFCDTKYGVTFPLFSKIDVNGDKTHPLYRFLKKEQPGDIAWNFTKFLVDAKGKPVKRFSSSVKPEDLEADVKGLLR